jgi:SulP family sulfate permease
MITPFFGGIAATGAVARTATNIRFGATSPLAAMFHALFALLAVLFAAPLVGYLPMPALAALLTLVAYNMSEYRHFFHITRVAPRSDVIVLWICFLLTVFFDMVIGVTAGVILASILFMKRMSELTSTQMVRGQTHPKLDLQVPKDVVVYEIQGPLFFGAAESAIEALQHTGNHVRAVIFVLQDVPLMDMTGLVAFESTLRRLQANAKSIFLVGLRDQPRELLTTVHLLEGQGIHTCDSVSDALSLLER